ncbi:hypothetical protein [Paenibacillus abyssi]|uniref:Uncharacterized protein n=1 Tax=Paenibacillus abyssi TaxID=1340531 RepID=A0A917CFF7_9BACL|nr:hypothetical protein [Paenibacillus abyssi]GGF87191.1 hypothetical protein GCM10010916_00650 [Paenibacillus abyssi]
MGKYGDWFVMIVAGGLIVFWLYTRFYRWLHTPSGTGLILLQDGMELDDDDEYVRLLESEGYIVSSGKHRIPIRIGLDEEVLHSRLYIDYVAEKNGSLFIVKSARDRMPIDWTGSGVRDRLLVYALLVPYCAGVLFVDIKEKQIRTITFHINEQ